MQVTIEVDEQLLDKAKSYTDLSEPSEVVTASLTALIQREAARRLARLGGTEPQLKPIPRRRMPK